MRFFNTAGPVKGEKHYCISPLERLNLEEILLLIEQEKYFVLHAPRQTGKTSCLLSLLETIKFTGKYKCIYLNVESAQGAREDVKRGIRAILSEIASRAKMYEDDEFVHDIWEDVLNKNGEDTALNEVLTRWTENSEKPIVLLMDEIDNLVGDTLISVLRQLRAGYDRRPELYPQSVVMCGVSDVIDYRIFSTRENTVITGGSAFNIKAKTIRLQDFTRADIIELFEQHTRETGQEFTPDAVERVWEFTRGQPWLTNALGYEACFELKEGKKHELPITADIIERAKDNLILRRETHLDHLMDKLQEEGVRRVIEPILAGRSFEIGFNTENVRYAIDLGLIKQSPNGAISIANKIYMEVIPRELSWSAQMGIQHNSLWYTDHEGFLKMDKLLGAFQKFYQTHSERWLKGFSYRDTGSQLLLQGFLQRIIDGEGRIERNYGLGLMRTDLLITWPLEKPENRDSQRIAIEIKVLDKALPDTTVADNLEQTAAIMDQNGATEGHLVIFDRDWSKNWNEKIFRFEKKFKGKPIVIWTM